MNDIEAELRSAFQRKQPSIGFAGRVAKAARGGRDRKRRQRWIGVAAAMLILCSFLSFSLGMYWQRRREAARTVDQLNLAVQITGQKLSLVRQAAARSLSEKDAEEKE